MIHIYVKFNNWLIKIIDLRCLKNNSWLVAKISFNSRGLPTSPRVRREGGAYVQQGNEKVRKNQLKRVKKQVKYQNDFVTTALILGKKECMQHSQAMGFSVVNFINILRANFVLIFFCQKKSIREKLCKAVSYEKGARKMMMKLATKCKKIQLGESEVCNCDLDLYLQ